jgi:hypothetical protein
MQWYALNPMAIYGHSALRDSLPPPQRAIKRTYSMQYSAGNEMVLWNPQVQHCKPTIAS